MPIRSPRSASLFSFQEPHADFARTSSGLPRRAGGRAVQSCGSERPRMKAAFRVGDAVIFRAMKASSNPGPRARNVYAAPHGELYSYQVDKYWLVAEVHRDGHLVLCTRRGKRHLVHRDSPDLRRAHWWERWQHRERFTAVSIAPIDA